MSSEQGALGASCTIPLAPDCLLFIISHNVVLKSCGLSSSLRAYINYSLYYSKKSRHLACAVLFPILNSINPSGIRSSETDQVRKYAKKHPSSTHTHPLYDDCILGLFMQNISRIKCLPHPTFFFLPPSPFTIPLLDSDGLGQVTREVDVETLHYSQPVGNQLEWDNV